MYSFKISPHRAEPANTAQLDSLAQHDARRRDRDSVEGQEPVEQRLQQLSDETASRLCLQTYGDGEIREFTAPQRPGLVPEMQFRSVSDVPSLNSPSLSFQRLASNIPVSGAGVVVDIDADHKTLVSIKRKVAVPETPAVADLSPIDAWAHLLDWAGIKVLPFDASETPTLTWFLDKEKNTRQLTYHFAGVPGPPRDEMCDDAHACVRPFLPGYHAAFANDGSVAFSFSSAPALEAPTLMTGLDGNNCYQTFSGLAIPTGYTLRR
jgi:hypothetical protein